MLPVLLSLGILYLLAIVAFILLGNLLPDAAGSASKTVYQLAVPVGLAIGLAGTLARSWPGPGQSIQTVVLAAVVVFEVAGPFLTRWSLVNAGGERQ
jgi:undecaprenyl pyrophosphate phosphatase UppP